MIKVNDILRSYSNFALEIEELSLHPNSCIGLVGVNGAGKTTFLKALLDLIPLERGRILSFGNEVARSERWKDYTRAYIGEDFLLGYLRPKEYFRFYAGLYNRNPEEALAAAENLFPFINDSLLDGDKYIRELSLGNKQRVGVASTLMLDAKVILLDEPFANLDPISQNNLKQIIGQQLTDKIILISSHNLHHLREIATHFLLIDEGKLIKMTHNTEDSFREIEQFFQSHPANLKTKSSTA
ncbi:MAG: ABC transporter ATP-binding protein [Bacteroidota bacterium]